MIVISSFKYGLAKVNSNLKFIILLLIVNISFAILLTGPVYLLLDDSLSRSLLGSSLIKSFDIQFFIELEYNNRDTIKFFPTIILLVGIIYAFIQIFLTGGIFEILNSNEKKNLFIDFFYGCVRYFYRFFIVFILSIICFGILYYLNLIYIEYINILTFKTESNTVLIMANISRYVIIAILFCFLNMVFDYVKISIVVKQSHNVFNVASFISLIG